MLKISYGDQEHSKLYVRREDSDEHLYLDYDDAKAMYKMLEKYVGEKNVREV